MIFHPPFFSLFYFSFFFFFNDTATTEIYTLSLHDALPIWSCSSALRAAFVVREAVAQPRHLVSAARQARRARAGPPAVRRREIPPPDSLRRTRSEEHTSELQSLTNLVCRLLLEKKKSKKESCEDDVATRHHVLHIQHVSYGMIRLVCLSCINLAESTVDHRVSGNPEFEIAPTL